MDFQNSSCPRKVSVPTAATKVVSPETAFSIFNIDRDSLILYYIFKPEGGANHGEVHAWLLRPEVRRQAYDSDRCCLFGGRGSRQAAGGADDFSRLHYDGASRRGTPHQVPANHRRADGEGQGDVLHPGDSCLHHESRRDRTGAPWSVSMSRPVAHNRHEDELLRQGLFLFFENI